MIPSAPSKARTHIQTAWTRFMEDRNFKATVADWETVTAADGSVLLSGRVAGPGAAYALQRFVAIGPLGLPRPGDTRPVVDYSVPGRTAYVWRSYGVWVELWVPDAEALAPAPVRPPAGRREPAEHVLSAPVPAKPSTAARARRGLGARLPFTRRSKKETNAA
jgi:hypothetical protein